MGLKIFVACSKETDKVVYGLRGTYPLEGAMVALAALCGVVGEG